MKKEKLLGFDILAVATEQFVEAIIDDIKEEEKKIVFAMNPNKVIISNKDQNLKKVLNKADYIIPDGFGIIFASLIKRGVIKRRVTGIDSMLLLCDKIKNLEIKIFLFGAQENIVEKTKLNLEKKYPGLQIVGTNSGYDFNDEKLIKKINKSKADILFVALGSPKQEYWIDENKSKLKVKIIQGVGGSFDVISGQVKRAPIWMRKIGLEWLYRVLKQPFRIKRILIFLEYIPYILKKEN